MRGQEGFTLVEVLLTVALLGIVATAMLNPLEATQRREIHDVDYAYAQQQARTGLDSMLAQIRQAYAVLNSGSNSVEMNVDLGQTAEHVLYECDIAQSGTSYHECLRVQAPVGSSLPSISTGTVVVSNLLNGTAADPVFSVTTDSVSGLATYVQAIIKVPASGATNGGLGHSIVFQDGAAIRNQSVGS